MLRAAMIAAGLLAWAPAHAAPPPGGGDPALAPWFQGLDQPGTGWPCCSIADCRPVNYRVSGDHLEAFIDRKTFGADAPEAWVAVPPEHILRHHDNPTGEGIACWYSREIRCFVEASGT